MEINEKNFDEFVDKIVEVENIPFMNAKDIHWKIPLPKTNEEFKKFTKKYYGVELSVEVIVWDDGVSYKIRESQNEYCKNELYSLWDKKFTQYDGLKVLLKSLFGDLSCGGVATSHYGQTKLDKSKREELVNWDGVDNEFKKEIANRQQQKDLQEIFS
ncbi:MAG: hypothetical protein KKB31_03475 [Nanoarchaeota archaeon]|nr:hypothetical protein [Nanoarchaeota archaeon]